MSAPVKAPLPGLLVGEPAPQVVVETRIGTEIPAGLVRAVADLARELFEANHHADWFTDFTVRLTVESRSKFGRPATVAYRSGPHQVTPQEVVFPDDDQGVGS